MLYGEARLPLARHARSAPAAKVRLTCAACASGHEVDASLVIWLLKAFGLGDELSPVGEAVKVASNPCVRCGATDWLATTSHAAPPRRFA